MKKIYAKATKELNLAFKMFPTSYFKESDSKEITHDRIIKIVESFNLTNAKKLILEDKLINYAIKRKEKKDELYF